MSSSPLERVQQDLNVIKSTLQSDFPYDRGSIILSAVAGLCGVPFALRAVPGWEGAMSGVLLALIIGLMVLSGGWLRHARAERGIRPRRWSWGREEIVSSAIAILGLIVYAVLTRWSAAAEDGWSFTTWRVQFAGPALFAFGIGMVALGVARWERRSLLGWGLAITANGMAMPWIPSRPAFWVVGGVAIALGGMVSALLMWWQLRQREDAHVGD
jgi:hypothetical protein